MDFKRVIEFLSWDEIPAEFISSLIVLFILVIFTIIINIKLKHYDPLKKPSGFLSAIEAIVSFTDKQVKDIMGSAFDGFGGYILFVGLYIFLGFFIGMIGIPNVFQPNSSSYLEALPNVFTNLTFPLSIALVTFTLTHATAIKYKKWAYFKRYTEPIFLFLPINLITMWSPVLSLTLRIFGNALAGYCVITLIYVGLGTALPPAGSYMGFVVEPLIAPIAHLYFDIFDGLIQLAVFTILTMINISNEYVSEEEYELAKRNKEEFKKNKLLKKKKTA